MRHQSTPSPPGTTSPAFREIRWQSLARANTHPLRVSILEVLGIDGGRMLSPSDLSYELRSPLSNINYHVTELHKSGLVGLASTQQVRGATEHFYRLTEEPEEANGNGASGNGKDLLKESAAPSVARGR